MVEENYAEKQKRSKNTKHKPHRPTEVEPQKHKSPNTHQRTWKEKATAIQARRKSCNGIPQKVGKTETQKDTRILTLSFNKEKKNRNINYFHLQQQLKIINVNSF